MTYHDSLGISHEEFEAVREQFRTGYFEGRRYEYLPDYRRSLERGTVLVDDVVVRGFPKIPRTLVLETGIPAFFDGPFAVEEKLNGYNVRVARVGDPVAFTRSGLACPFTTRKIRSALDLEAFFDAHPEAVLCGEMVGRESPYTDHDYPDVDSLDFRAFDVRSRATGEPMPVRERREECEAFDIPQSSLLGTVSPDAPGAVREIVDELDAEGREGVVMKSLDGADLLKYTTGSANRGDLAHAFAYPFDYGQEFVFHRVAREAFQAVEWGHDEDEEALRRRAHEIGESILLPMVEAIRTVEAGADVGERHTVRGPRGDVDRLLSHLNEQGLAVDVESERSTDGESVVTFRKRTQATNDKIADYLAGGVVRP